MADVDANNPVGMPIDSGNEEDRLNQIDQRLNDLENRVSALERQEANDEPDDDDSPASGGTGMPSISGIDWSKMPKR
jgi:hypothetical protein